MKEKEFPQNPRYYSRRMDGYVRPPTTRQQLRDLEPLLAEGYSALHITLSTKAHTLEAHHVLTLDALKATVANVPYIENSRTRLVEAKFGIKLLRELGQALVDREERLSETTSRR